MDGHIDTTPEPIPLPQIRPRIPLIPKRNSSTTTKQIRRKGSFIRRVDSSEESPSPHGSIFEAYYHSTTNSDESGQVDSRSIKPLAISNLAAPCEQGRENNENSRIGQMPASNTSNTGYIQSPYVRGTLLETIVERNSLGSIKILARAQSVDNLHSSPSLGHQDSFVLDNSPRRQKSLSLDNLSSIKDSYHQAGAMTERTTQKPSPIQEIYAQPKAPIQEPPQRPETPPGMPSWTEHQLRPSQRASVNGATNRLQRFFGLRPFRASLSSHITPPAARSRSVSAPVGSRRPRTARYRPPKSIYGRIDQHPFNHAPTAVVDPFPPQSMLASPGKRKSVRFTPSATARDSEIASPQAVTRSLCASTPQSVAQEEPVTPNHPAASQPKAPEEQRQCPHRKCQRIALKHRLSSNTSTPGIEYQAILSHPLTCQDSILSLPHILTPSPTHPTTSTFPRREDGQWDLGIIDMGGTPSNSSTAHLMSGALLAPSPSPTQGTRASHQDTSIPVPSSDTKQCWRCRLRVMVDKMEKLWERGANYFCLICCGFVADDDESTLAPRHAMTELGSSVQGYHEMTGGPRTIRGWWDRMESPLSNARRANTGSPQAG